jgi:hypothetical protein
MKISLKLLLPPVVLMLCMGGAYFRGDTVGLCIFAGAFVIWLLVISRRRSVRSARKFIELDMPVRADSETAKSQLNDRVRWVASAFASDLSVMRVRAKVVASESGPNSIDQLASLFHTEHTPPPELSASFGALGHWITARQFAIFEIFYNLGKESIPTLKRVAFGAYDWTQGNAIEILCRLAADDVNQKDIVTSLVARLPSIREEAHGYALRPLLAEAKTNPALRAILDQLLIVPEFRESYEQVMCSIGDGQ